MGSVQGEALSRKSAAEAGPTVTAAATPHGLSAGPAEPPRTLGLASGRGARGPSAVCGSEEAARAPPAQAPGVPWGTGAESGGYGPAGVRAP